MEKQEKTKFIKAVKC